MCVTRFCLAFLGMALLWVLLATATHFASSAGCNAPTKYQEDCSAMFVTSSLPDALATGSSLIITANVSQPKNQFWNFFVYFKRKRIISYLFLNAEITEATAGCLSNNGRLSFNHSLIGTIHHFTFKIQNLSDSETGSAVALNCDSCISQGKGCLEKIGQVTVHGCKSMTIQDVVISTKIPSPGFNDIGTFQCVDHSGQVFYNNRTPASLTRCNEYAKWEDISNVRCHYSPTVTSVKRTLSNGSELHIANFCKVRDGYPKDIKTYLVLNHQNRTTTIIKNGTVITPKYHGLKASCFVENDFGNDTDHLTLNVTFRPIDLDFTLCRLTNIEGSKRYSVRFHLNFKANPPQGDLKLSGLNDVMTFNKSCEIHGIAVNCTILIDNVTSDDVAVTFIYEQRVLDNTTLGVWNITLGVWNTTEQCIEDDSATTVVATASSVQPIPVNSPMPSVSTSSKPTTFEGKGTSTANTEPGYIVAAAVGGVSVIAIIVVIALIVRRRWKSGKHEASSSNAAIVVSTFSRTQDTSRRLDQSNIIYDTADLKAGGNTKEVADNVLYGTANDVANLNDEGAGGLALGLQTEATYAVLDKQKKKGKKNAEKQAGQVNMEFCCDLEESATYAVVDKKNKKGKEDATYAALDKTRKKNLNGKRQGGPSSSGLTEDCTYAEVRKKDKKLKKDGPNDGDLHGSSKK